MSRPKSLAAAETDRRMILPPGPKSQSRSARPWNHFRIGATSYRFRMLKGSAPHTGVESADPRTRTVVLVRRGSRRPGTPRLGDSIRLRRPPSAARRAPGLCPASRSGTHTFNALPWKSP
jgi:hypothetical protein